MFREEGENQATTVLKGTGHLRRIKAVRIKENQDVKVG